MGNPVPVEATSSPEKRTFDKPVFTVILTTFNRSKLLPRAIDSILQQSFGDFEVVVVDDASTDGTSDVMTELTDPRITYLRQAKNQGVSAARNWGIAVAKGDFIAFVDDDDTISPAFLREVYEALAQAPSRVGFIWTWKEVVRQSGDGVELVRMASYHSAGTAPIPGNTFLEYPNGASGGLVVRAEAFRTVGVFNPELRTVEDTELLIRLARAYDYIVLPSVLYQIFTTDGERLTNPNRALAQSYERIIALHEGWIRAYPGTLTVMYKGAARTYYQLGERAKARHYMKLLLRYQPFNWRNWLLLILLEALPLLPAAWARRALAR